MGKGEQASSREYLVEVYSPRMTEADVVTAEALGRRAAARMSGEGIPVRYVRAIYVREDETCFHLFEAPSAGAAAQATAIAGLGEGRVVESLATSLGASGNGPGA